MIEPAKIKRYALDRKVGRMFPETHGTWVKFADVESALKAPPAASRNVPEHPTGLTDSGSRDSLVTLKDR